MKTVFRCRYLHSEPLRREINEGLNVIERWNGANDCVFFAKPIAKLRGGHQHAHDAADSQPPAVGKVDDTGRSSRSDPARLGAREPLRKVGTPQFVAGTVRVSIRLGYSLIGSEARLAAVKATRIAEVQMPRFAPGSRQRLRLRGARLTLVLIGT